MPNLEHAAEMAEEEEEELSGWRDHQLGDIYSPARVAHYLDTLPGPQRLEWMERFRLLVAPPPPHTPGPSWKTATATF